MATNKHHKYLALGDGRAIKVPTRAGARRAKRRSRLVELVMTSLRQQRPWDNPNEPFQDAVRMEGARLADRRWLLARMRKGGAPL